MCKYSVETIAAQAGNHIDDKKAVALPLYFSSNYRHDSLEEAKNFDPRLLIVEHLNKQWQSLKPVSVVLL